MGGMSMAIPPRDRRATPRLDGGPGVCRRFSPAGTQEVPDPDALGYRTLGTSSLAVSVGVLVDLPGVGANLADDPVSISTPSGVAAALTGSGSPTQRE